MCAQTIHVCAHEHLWLVCSLWLVTELSGISSALDTKIPGFLALMALGKPLTLVSLTLLILKWKL